MAEQYSCSFPLYNLPMDTQKKDDEEGSKKAEIWQIYAIQQVFFYYHNFWNKIGWYGIKLHDFDFETIIMTVCYTIVRIFRTVYIKKLQSPVCNHINIGRWITVNDLTDSQYSYFKTFHENLHLFMSFYVI